MQPVGFNSLKIRSLQDFKIVSTFSNTKFGSVSFALHIPTREYMILKYRISSELKPTEASKESATYMRIGPHPHVCRFLGYCIIDKRMIMGLKYYSLGDLKTQIERHREQGIYFNYQHVWYLFLHVAKALHHIHSRGFIFADLKPGNILLDEEIYSNTFGCEMTYINEDAFSRDCNCNFLLCDFGHALEARSSSSTHEPYEMPLQSKFCYSQDSDKVRDMMSLKKVINSINEISENSQQIRPSELLASSPRRKFSSAEVTNYEITRCGTFAYESEEERNCKQLSGKTDVYSLALIGIELLMLKKLENVGDDEFERIDDDLKRFIRKMIGPEKTRPSAFDVYEKAVNVLQCHGYLVQDAVKNTSELLQERMVEMQRAASPENSVYVRPESGRPSSSRPVSARVSYRKSRPASYIETINSIVEEQSREATVIGKQGVPSPVVEKLLRTSRFLDKWNKAHWDWDVEATNVIDPKQNYCTDSVIAEFGLSSEMQKFEASQNREQTIEMLRRGNRGPIEDNISEVNASRHDNIRKSYINTKGGGAVVRSTWMPPQEPSTTELYSKRSSSPKYRSVFQRRE